jgi:hypothetical protein
VTNWIEELAAELCKRRYRTLCEAELIELIRRYARSGHANIKTVENMGGTICCRTEEDSGDGIVTIRFENSVDAHEFAEHLEAST